MEERPVSSSASLRVVPPPPFPHLTPRPRCAHRRSARGGGGSHSRKRIPPVPARGDRPGGRAASSPGRRRGPATGWTKTAGVGSGLDHVTGPPRSTPSSPPPAPGRRRDLFRRWMLRCRGSGVTRAWSPLGALQSRTRGFSSGHLESPAEEWDDRRPVRSPAEEALACRQMDTTCPSTRLRRGVDKKGVIHIHSSNQTWDFYQALLGLVHVL
nr:uncharacterized protein LOC123568834 [Macaca fascicularis]